MKATGVGLVGVVTPVDLAQATVAVLCGGASGEREVSLSSGREVLAALGKDDGRGPGRCLAVEIDQRGAWLVGTRRLDAASALVALAEVDVFFLALHGGAGEDGTVQGLLESAGRVYTGSGVRASALCMDKLATRGVAGACGVRTAPGLCFGLDQFMRDPAHWLARCGELSAAGWAVKPRCGGSSVATTMVAPGGDLQAALSAALATGDDCLVEARIDGVECSCGVLGNRGEALRPLPPVEIRPAPGRFFDYQQKYSADGARELCPPESLDRAAVTRVQERAATLFAAAGCDGYARIDFIVPPDGEPVLLEANTLPGFTARSLLPQEAAVVGLDYRSLVLWVIEAALRRRGRTA